MPVSNNPTKDKDFKTIVTIGDRIPNNLLIEDEVLLALPISPRHETCSTPQQMGTKQDASPFAVLRNLKID